MAHAFSSLFTHIVFSTKSRLPLIANDEIEQQLHSYMAGIINEQFGCLKKVNGTFDHIHMLVEIDRRVSVADMLRVIKCNSTNWVNKTFFHSLPNKFAWQIGYGAFSVSASAVNSVSKYIEKQKTHHRQFSFQGEFMKLLKKHNIQYCDKHLWD